MGCNLAMSASTKVMWGNTLDSLGCTLAMQASTLDWLDCTMDSQANTKDSLESILARSANISVRPGNSPGSMDCTRGTLDWGKLGSTVGSPERTQSFPDSEG
jgi:hypothetical protein